MNKSIHQGAAKGRMLGLTLVELMVSMTIGLVLMLAIVSAYIGAAGAGAIAQAQGRMNEDAQAALAVLTQHIRMAANNPKQPGYATDTPRNPVFDANTWGIRGCDNRFSDVATAASVSALTCVGSGADSLVVAYEADRYNTVATGGAMSTDCLGQTLPTTAVTNTGVKTVTPPGTVLDPTVPRKIWNGVSVQPTPVNFTIAENRFYISTSAAVPVPSLYCKGNGGAAPQPLAENVEDMQITYGVATTAASTTLTVAGYLTASEVDSSATLNPLTPEQRWAKVATVRICLIVRSELPIAPSAESAQYFDCTGTLVASPPDLRLRRAYTTTVVLRNRATL